MESPLSYSFSIAGLVIGLRTSLPIKVTEPFLPFLTEAESDYTALFREVPDLPAVSGRALFRSVSYTVYRDEQGGYFRLFRDAAHEETVPYALSRTCWENRQVLIDVLPTGREFVSESGNCFFHTGWENLLLREKRLILHGACVDTPLGGLLFSGPSGIGKSTQAELWCRYGDGRQINGDRPILHKQGRTWYAWGSPYAGSSHCHVNASCPLRAIVMLRQAESCTLCRLGAAEAFRKLFAGLTVSSWAPEAVAAAGDLAEELACDVPVYELACTPDQNAVEMLRQELSGGVSR